MHGHEAAFIASIQQFSYIAIFVFALFSGYLIPIPEEIILLITGYMASVHYVQAVPAVFFLIAAFVISDNVLFRLALRHNRRVAHLLDEVLSIKIIARNKAWLERHINTTVFLTRFFPFVRFAGPIVAGYMQAKEGAFMIFDTLALAVYVPFVVWVGYFFHTHFFEIIDQIGRFRHIGIILLWIVIGLIITRIVDYIFRKDEAARRKEGE